MTEKRKNDQPRRFQWWLLVVGFALGVALTLALSMRNGTRYVYVADAPPDGLWMTATSIVQEATAAAMAQLEQSAALQPPQPPQALQSPQALQPLEPLQPLDALLATATKMVIQATQTAQAGG